jgi:catechol 2,3-dioxygenase-like lactoylglutathione lyase family enzyme
MADSSQPSKPPFRLLKLGHIVLNCVDIDASVRFYTEVLGLQISDVYGDDLVPGRMVFMRFSADHHGIALVGGAASGPRNELNHFALEVATLDEVFAARQHLMAHGVPINFQGRRRAGSQIAVEFKDPDGNNVEIFWGLDQVGPDGYVRPSSEWRQALTLEDATANAVRGQQIPPHLK